MVSGTTEPRPITRGSGPVSPPSVISEDQFGVRNRMCPKVGTEKVNGRQSPALRVNSGDSSQGSIQSTPIIIVDGITHPRSSFTPLCSSFESLLRIRTPSQHSPGTKRPGYRQVHPSRRSLTSRDRGDPGSGNLINLLLLGVRGD